MGTAVAAWGCGGALREVQHKSFTHPEADFSRYKTWVAVPRDQMPWGYERTELSPKARQVAVAAAVGELEKRGWREADSLEAADVVLITGVGRRTRKEGSVTPSLTPGDFAMLVEADEREIQEGSIVVDAFDRRSRRHIWHGHVSAQIRGDRKRASESDWKTFRDAVARIFVEFPRAKGTAQTAGDTDRGANRASE